MSAAVGLDLDVVYVVGLSEDLYPGRLREDALLPDRVRDGEPRRAGVVPRHARRASTGTCSPRSPQRRAWSRPSRAATCAAARRRLPSRWLLPTLRELSGDRTLAATEWEHGELAPADHRLAVVRRVRSPTDAAGHRAGVAHPSGGRRALRSTTPIVDAARRADPGAAPATRFTRFDGNLAGVDGLPDYADGERAVSPTALERYAGCPHAYFVAAAARRRAARAARGRSSRSARSTSATSSTRASTRFVTEFAGDAARLGEPWTAEQRARLREIAAGEGRRVRAARARPATRGCGSASATASWPTSTGMLDDDDRRRAERDARVSAQRAAVRHATAPPGRGRVDGRHGADAGQRRQGRRRPRRHARRHRHQDRQHATLQGISRTTRSSAAPSSSCRSTPTRRGSSLGGRPPPRRAYWFVRRDKRGWIERRAHRRGRGASTPRRSATLVAVDRGRAVPARRRPEAPDFAWVQCAYCNPDGLGHGEVRERWERKRHDPALRELVALIEPERCDDPTDGAG